jgi:hypothetical protein
MTHEEEREKVISKIEKLLALAGSANEHEAKLAATKAAELLTMYNLTMEQVSGERKEYQHRSIFNNIRRSQENKYITDILIGFFFVELIKSRRYDRFECRFYTKVIMIGTKTNVQIASFVYAYLEKKYIELWQTYRKTHKAKANQKQSYYMGLTLGLMAQLKEKRRECENKVGLMVIKDDALRKHIKRDMGVEKETTPNVNIEDGEAVAHGIEHGYKIQIQKGLEEKPLEKGNLLR